jgi:hypothetical protein
MRKTSIFKGFMIFVAIVCLLTFALNMINNRFNLGDFRVYYTAARNLVFGGPVYMVSFDDGSGFYKYSPSTLFFFIPYIFFNFKIAEIIHFFILGTAYWYTMVWISRLIKTYFLTENINHEAWLLSISFACILIHFSRELFLGNINIILLLLCCFSIQKFLTKKDLQGSILLGIVILAKPYFLILLLPLILRKRWRALAWLGLTISCGLIIPFIYPGPQKSLTFYGDWIKSILNHQGVFPGMTSIDYLCNTIFPSWPSWGIFAILISICLLFATFILNNLQTEKQQRTFAGMADMNFMFEWFLTIALLPNLIRTDWVLMLFTAPLITFNIYYIASKKQYWWIPVLIILFFFYSANSDDLLGRNLSHKILQSGLMGLSNFLLVVVSSFMFLNLRKLPPSG